MDKENNEKLEKIKKAFFDVVEDKEDITEEKILKEEKKVVLKGNHRKDLQTE